MGKRRPEWLGPEQKEMLYGPPINSMWKRDVSIWRVNSVSNGPACVHVTLFRIGDAWASWSVPLDNFWKEWREYHG